MKRTGLIVIALALWAGLTWGQYGYQYVSGGWWFGAQFIGQEGWMVGAGGSILNTTDGGRNWVFQNNIESQPWYGDQNLTFNDGFFKNPQEGWACINHPTSFVWHTTDGGRFWKAESIPSRWPYGAYTTKLIFADMLHGWLVGERTSEDVDDGNILATSDGGRTWVFQDTSHGWVGVWATDGNHCWAVGYNGWTARTTDGGTTWVKQQVPPNKTLYEVSFSDTMYGWACGNGGTIVRTMDGGVTWAQQMSGITRELWTSRSWTECEASPQGIRGPFSGHPMAVLPGARS